MKYVSYKQSLGRAKRQKSVHLRMKTEDGKFVDRTIDIANILIHSGDSNYISKDCTEQRNLLEEWIKLRGNDQHATKLTLLSWTIS